LIEKASFSSLLEHQKTPPWVHRDGDVMADICSGFLIEHRAHHCFLIHPFECLICWIDVAWLGIRESALGPSAQPIGTALLSSTEPWAVAPQSSPIESAMLCIFFSYVRHFR
jgi:hypothetical protein